MTVASAQVSVGTSATLLARADADGSSVAVRNAGTASVWLGPQAVTTANGLELVSGATLAADLDAGEALFAIAASGTVAVHVLTTRA